MRGGRILVQAVAAATLLVSSEAHQDANDVANAQTTFLSKGDARRLLRARDTISDDKDDVDLDENDGERMNLSPETEKWLAKLVTMSDDELNAIAKAPANINVELTLSNLKTTAEAGFQKLIDGGATPQKYYKSLKIRQKRKKLTEEQLMRDKDYQFYTGFKNFWDSLKAKTT